MAYTLEQKLNKLVATNLLQILPKALKGIEKESLRVTPDGHISRQPHPPSLGSALTHPFITTDYSEALLEFRTPPLASMQAGLDFLSDLHAFTCRRIQPELIWPASMPCVLDEDDSIPVARYGSSNVGQMKHVYRLGLGYRYGRAMQAIAGIHFNYSLPDDFWQALYCLDSGKESLRFFVDRSYFGALRNFHRWGWIISYLFGSSPAMCSSFAKLRGGEYEKLGKDTAYGRYATSLRMSDSGYKNKNQAGLKISYNSLDEYVADLRHAISTPQSDYEKIGVKVDGRYRQLNANLLQIENEYYSFIRPKQIARSGEKPSSALRDRGVQYLEVRALDVNPFDLLGMNAPQLHFIETLLLHCVLADSPPLSLEDSREVESNQTLVACRGRDPDLRLTIDGSSLSVSDWVLEILRGMTPIADVLDQSHGTNDYTRSLSLQLEANAHPETLPSSRILRELQDSGTSYWEFTVRMAQVHAERFKTSPIAIEREREFTEAAAESLASQRAIEARDTLSFDTYLANYFAR